MTIRAILETETMDPDFKEPFLNGMPFDITKSTFDRIVRYASGCTNLFNYLYQSVPKYS